MDWGACPSRSETLNGVDHVVNAMLRARSSLRATGMCEGFGNAASWGGQLETLKSHINLWISD